MNYIYIVIKLLLCLYALPHRLYITFSILWDMDFILHMYLCSGTYIVLLSQHQSVLIWGFEKYQWCLEEKESLSPSCRVGSCTKSLEITLKRGITYLLILFLCQTFCILQKLLLWSLVNCELQGDVYLLESKCFKYSV